MHTRGVIVLSLMVGVLLGPGAARANLQLDVQFPSCDVTNDYTWVQVGIGRLTLVDQNMNVVHRQSNVSFSTFACTAHLTITFNQAQPEPAPACAAPGVPDACCTGPGMGRCLLSELINPQSALFIKFEVCGVGDTESLKPSGVPELGESAAQDALPLLEFDDLSKAQPCDFTSAGNRHLRQPHPLLAADEPLDTLLNDLNGAVQGGLAAERAARIAADALLESEKVNRNGGDTISGGLTVNGRAIVNNGLTVSDGLSVMNGPLSIMNDAAANQYLIKQCPAGLTTRTVTFTNPGTGATTMLCASDFRSQTTEELTIAEELGTIAAAGCDAIAKFPLSSTLDSLTKIFANLLTFGLNFLTGNINIGLDTSLSALQFATETAVNAVVSGINWVTAGLVGAINATIDGLNSALCTVSLGTTCNAVGHISAGSVSPISLSQSFSNLIPPVQASDIQSGLDFLVVDPFGELFSLVQSNSCNTTSISGIIDYLVAGLQISVVSQTITRDTPVPVYTGAESECAGLNAHVCTQGEIYLMVKAASQTDPADIGYQGGEWVNAGEVVKDKLSPTGFNFAGAWPPVRVQIFKLVNWPPQPPFTLENVPTLPTGRFQCCLESAGV